MRYPKSNINLYKFFVEIYKTKNVSQASKKLHVSQSAVSQNIKTLEKQLNCTLFKKTTKYLKPTESANLIFDKIVVALNTISHCEELLENKQDENCGEIKIGVQSFLVSAFLAEILLKYHMMYPNISINIVDKSSTTMLEMLKKEDVDFIIDIDPPELVDNNLKIDKLTNVESCFIADQRSRIESIKAEDFEYLHFIISTKKSRVYQYLLNNIEDFYKARTINAYTTENIITLTKMGFGIGVVFKACAEKEVVDKKLKFVNSNFKMPSSQIFACYEKNGLSRIGRKFLNFIKKNV